MLGGGGEDRGFKQYFDEVFHLLLMDSFVYKLRYAAHAVRFINCTSLYFIANIIFHNIPIKEKVSAVFGSCIRIQASNYHLNPCGRVRTF